jgi:hypothetical protein
MRQDYTHIAVVIDKSGSMGVRRNDVIGGFNRFLDDQKKVPGKATMTLVMFDTVYQVVHTGADISSIIPLDNGSYAPAGGTALFDAMAKAISESGKYLSDMAEVDRPAKVIVVVLTDGEENSSRETTIEQLKEAVDRQKNVYKWEFVFLGVGIDAFQQGAGLGVPMAAMANLGASGQYMRAAYAATSKNIIDMRQGKMSTFTYNPAQVKAMAGDDKKDNDKN